jgi:DASS family divalent anion:Na+ symporter
MQWKALAKFGICVLIGLVIWFLPRPEGLSVVAWHLFAVFFATIVCIIVNPYPMGPITLIALTISLLTGIVSWGDTCTAFGHDIVWLVVFAFFIAKGFISTGLGNRIAYAVMKRLGKNSLGLGYGIVATNLILSPGIPSMTARVGGVVFPMMKGLAEVFTGKSHDPRMGAFLSLCAYQSTAITCAMFLTAMSGNPLIASFAQEQGVTITWASWAIAAIVPGMISLAILPYFIYRFWPPMTHDTPHIRELAREKLKEMGPMSRKEKIMAATLILLIFLWIIGRFIGLKETVSAMVGLSILLLMGVLKWKDILEEYSAWDTLIWFASLMTLACQLNKTGFSSWLSQSIVVNMQGLHWGWGFLALTLIYFYSHYFFASTVAHISAMYAPFLVVALAIGTPPQLAALLLAFISNLYIGLTHYGSGAAPIIFSTGYVSIGEWWKVGLIFSFVLLAIWLGVGAVWWKIIGIW